MSHLPCDQCVGQCCIWPSRSPAARELAPGIQFNADDGRCTYLGDDNRCAIYAIRPQVCRDFTCNTRRYRWQQPAVDALLTREGVTIAPGPLNAEDAERILAQIRMHSTRDEGRFTQADAKVLRRLLPFQNLHGIQQVLNAMEAEFPEDE